MFELTDTQREVLAAVCDTVVPAIAGDRDRDGFFARKASDLWVPQVVEYLLAGMPNDQRASLGPAVRHRAPLDVKHGAVLAPDDQQVRGRQIRRFDLHNQDSTAEIESHFARLPPRVPNVPQTTSFFGPANSDFVRNLREIWVVLHVAMQKVEGFESLQPLLSHLPTSQPALTTS